MREVNFNKQMQRQYAVYRYAYNFTHKTTLEDCYKSYSYAKKRAYDYCRNLQHKLNGYDFTIIGHNCCTFSVGFCYDDTNNSKHFVWITPSYERDCIVE